MDITALAHTHGVTVHAAPQDEAIYGSLQLRGTQPQILINSRQPVALQRFTIAHELAHYLLHRPVLERQKVIDFAGEESLPPEEEAAADTLATELLLPKETIESLFARFARSADAAQQMATQAQVPLGVMHKRLQQLGYLSPAFCSLPL